MSVVIVAIPEAQDRVWKVSSEKIPHLTMLFLGDDVPADQLQRIVLFVEHVAKTTLTPFGLSVDRRGELGDDKADVVFFEKERYTNLKEIKAARDALLTNRDIYEAYHSAEQFPEWTPHLTLGYPAAPAKEDEFGIHYVSFDRIAVWTGDFDGPEFFLKDRDSAVSDVSGVGWSSIARGRSAMAKALVMMEEAKESDALQFGIKGMKWGVRRSRDELAALRNAPADPDAVKAVQTQAKIRANNSLNVVSSKDLNDLVKRIELESKYVGLTTSQSQQAAKGQSFLSKVISNEAGYFLTGKKGPVTKLVASLSNKSNKHLTAALAAAKVAQAAKPKKAKTTTNPLYNTYKATPGPASRRTKRAQQVYNVTSMGQQGNFGDPNLVALNAPPRRKP